ncbi:ABC transporter permease [Micromonospora sp. BQ11]|uniref:ABC transporter permease n=1 Tax=Micromonospora sp. BQ11 TaxID=3452212 RepID=UPI003F89308E
MNLVRSELLKIRTTSTWWILALIYLPLWGITLFFNYLQSDALVNGNMAEAPEDQAATIEAVSQPEAVAANLFTNGQFFGLMMVMLLGIIVVTSEFFHQTVTTTFLTVPHRTAVMLAKLVAAAALGVLFWLVTTAANLLAGAAVLGGIGLDPSYSGAVWEAVGLNGLAYLLWAILGVGLGVLIRSQIGATVTGILLYLGGSIGAVIIISVLAERYGDWINKLQLAVPSLASSLMVTGTDGIPGNPPQWAGAAVLIGYALVAGVVGTLMVRRRDIS